MKSQRDKEPAGRKKEGFFRPVSIMILAAIVVVVLMGLNYIFVKDNPERFAGFLMMNFLFFFIAVVLAIDDIARIITASVKQRHEIYSDTLGDQEFCNQLREEVHRHLPSE